MSTQPPAARAALRARSRTRLTCFVAAPVLFLTVSCADENGTGSKDNGVASVPNDPSPGGSKTPGPDGGTEKTGSGGKGAFYDAQMTYVQCMRGKGGVKNFPDPKLSGYLDWTKIDEIGRSNQKVYGAKGGPCVDKMLAADALAPPRNTQKDYEAMLAHAKCMRENGVSKFTNPTLSGGGVVPGGDPNPVSPQIDPESPAYKQAREACKDKLLDGLDGMQ
ncbi:hypothetical protein [Streptomyces sp. NBC_00829]|uniref:hypothetical protein n=1 Tax=Streptomyces sp. NBC_00829 TaxID=2903679 RepID=UPI00386A257A|nr:hypothetical protein OG293_01560 [Streptomyces sp. NBC_00829]